MIRVVLDPPSKPKSENNSNNFNQGRPAQSEKELEEEFIKKLVSQGYEYVDDLSGEEKLKENLRKQLERLNAKKYPGFKFTDSEWKSFYRDNFDGPDNQGVERKAEKIHEGECIFSFVGEDGITKNLKILDKKEPQNNHVQVANQTSNTYGKERDRYDVTILVNGLPLVHIELKSRGRTIYEAFAQNNRYQMRMHSLFEFVQIFVISNGSETKYYSNTTAKDKGKNSFTFTSYWSYSNNQHIEDLETFTETFFKKEVLLEIIRKYCVFDSEKRLKIMRPYQIAATERIIERIHEVINNPDLFQHLDNSNEDLRPGGYVWHTTGSGKTLTSFKTAQLALKIPEVHKVLFIVDRKSLDQQTQREYRTFSGDDPDTLSGTHNTRELEKEMNSNERKIIITTIHKLKKFMKKLETDGLSDKFINERIVMIVDECHRSQVEETHKKIFSIFPKRIMFGFTGTPLFEDSKEDKKPVDWCAQRFGKCLHKYQIVHAIEDQNVLKFVIEHAGSRIPVSVSEQTRRKGIAKYVFENFSRLSRDYLFNSIFASKNIEAAIEYYKLFKELNAEARPRDRLKVALVFKSEIDVLSEEGEDQSNKYKGFLEEAIQDYNKLFGTNFCESKFDEYRDDVAKRTREKQIDILLVVCMFLTGYDAPCINTVWVDKHLEAHGLIQAFSRANRLSKGKPHANIVCFRDKEETQKKIDEAFTLFALGDEDRSSKNAVFIQTEEQIADFVEIQAIILEWLKSGLNLDGLEDKKHFVKDFRKFHNLKELLKDNVDFQEKLKIDEGTIQDLTAKYLDAREEVKRSSEKNQLDESEIKEFSDAYNVELLERIEIDAQYIISLVIKYRKELNLKDKEKLLSLIKTDPKLRGQIEVFEEYLSSIDSGNKQEYQEIRRRKLSQKLKDIADNLKLKQKGVEKLVDKCLEEGRISFDGITWKDIFSTGWITNPQSSRIRAELRDKLFDLFEWFNIFDESWNEQAFARAEENYESRALKALQIKETIKEDPIQEHKAVETDKKEKKTIFGKLKSYLPKKSEE